MRMSDFKSELDRQRKDDHRFYHQSRINQSLHLISAISFLGAYALVFVDPLAAVLVAWLVGMVTRQTGHYVFEPSRYDTINQASNEHKESIKIGFNQKRKTILIAAVIASPWILWFDPTLFGLLSPHTTRHELAEHVAIIWLIVAAVAIAIRVLQLCLTRSALTAVVWVYKIATDPIHNVRIYWKSPFYLFRGQLYDPLETETGTAAALEPMTSLGSK